MMPAKTVSNYPEKPVAIGGVSPGYALYLHIPFCRHRCSYCDFNTYTTVNDLMPAYVQALAAEINQVAQAGLEETGQRPRIDTIYFGGGTPSLLSLPQLGLILESVARGFDLNSDAEVTLEANPETVDLTYLQGVHSLGVNRLSFGVQSALGDELALLGRTHSFVTAVKALEMARKAGFDNINLDFIYGLPDQSLANWKLTLEASLQLAPQHFSLYCLTIEPGTPMQRWLLNGQIALPDPDLAADQYQLACDVLADQGYGHYEISNWAADGLACRHNLIYWRNASYFGLGAGAHGFAGDYRYHVVRRPRTYIRRMAEGPPPVPFPLTAATAASHIVGPDEGMSDTVITQLRLLDEGMDLVTFERQFGRAFDEVYDEPLSRMEGLGLLHRRGNRLLLTEKGWFLSNYVFREFI